MRLYSNLTKQERIEQHLEDNLSREGNIRVERGKTPISLVLEEQAIDNPLSHPIKLRIESDPKAMNIASSESSGSTKYSEIIDARYVVGCDGANSWVRDQMNVGVQFRGTDSIWGFRTTSKPT